VYLCVMCVFPLRAGLGVGDVAISADGATCYSTGNGKTVRLGKVSMCLWVW
jgi:hypothetical protein